MIFIDSNIWCYYFDRRLPEHQLVREPVRKILLSNQEIACNTIVVLEIAHFLVRHFEEMDAKKKIEHFVNLRNLRIFDFNAKLMAESLESLLNYSYSSGLGGRDSTIVATVASQDIESLMTHDSVFKRMSGTIKCKILDPIAVKEN